MGRGSGAKRLSAGSYGGGSKNQQINPKTANAVQGVAIKDIQNPTLKTTLQDITRDIMTGKSYSYTRSQKDGKAIEKNTNVGDIFTHQNISYQKTANNQWQEMGNPNNSFASDGMARILAGLTSLPGTWTYKRKQ